MKVDNLKVFGDERGNLVALEEMKDIPFEIKRIFYIYGNNNNEDRGNHAHYETKQYIICLSGSCNITLDDGKHNKETYKLDKPNKGLLQDCKIWGSMHDFSKDCILLVLASEKYEMNDYIHDYEMFKRSINNAKS